MGEYLNGVKLGTCNTMYWITYDEMLGLSGKQLENSSRRIDGYFFLENMRYRFPFPGEMYDEFEKYNDRQLYRGFHVDLKGKPYALTGSFRETTVLNHTLCGEVLSSQIGGYQISMLFECPNSEKFETSQYGKKTNVLPYMVRYEILKKIDGDLKLKTLFECAYCGESFILEEKDVELMQEIVKDQHGEIIAKLIK